jgi:uncharacterized membrane protein HdeD (DUF308 family)
MTRPFDALAHEAPDVLAVHWGWVIALGLLVVALGVLALLRARTATVLAVGFLGVLLVVSAVSILLFAFTTAGYWTDFFVHVLWAVLAGIVGLILLTRPAISAEAITLMVSFYFLAEGFFVIGFALGSRLEGLWIHLGQGLISLVLGAMLLVGWPFTGLFAIGAFLGVDLFFKGWGIVALGLGLRAISEGSLF